MIEAVGGRCATVAAGPSVGEPAARDAAGVGAKPRGVDAGSRAVLSGIVSDLARSPPIDSGKVERLKAAIANGTYTIDPDAIAARMIALETPRAG